MTIVWFLLAVILLIVMISKLKIHAFLSLLAVALIMGFAGGLSAADVTNAVAMGFGGTMQNIGIVIVCGIVIGEILELTGGAQKIADSILKVIGIKRATTATTLTGAVVSIPVFCDSGFVILNPVIKALSRTGKIPYMSLVIALMGGLLTTHSFIPPTPGPIAAAGVLGADIGKVMLYGLIAAVPVVIAISLWANSRFIRNRYPEIAEADQDVSKVQEFEEVVKKAPSTFLSYLPILIPIVLIVVASFSKQSINQQTAVAAIINFLGTPFVALMIGTGFAFLLPTKLNSLVTETWVSTALSKSAEILLITGAAGSFGKVLQSTNIGNILAGGISGIGLPAILVPFIIAALVLIAQGSATVALLTTSALIAPMISTMGISPEMAVIAIAAGSFTGVQSNGSYFWCVSKMAGFDIKKSYVAVTLTTLIMGAAALGTVLLMSLIFK